MICARVETRWDRSAPAGGRTDPLAPARGATVGDRPRAAEVDALISAIEAGEVLTAKDLVRLVQARGGVVEAPPGTQPALRPQGAPQAVLAGFQAVTALQQAGQPVDGPDESSDENEGGPENARPATRSDCGVAAQDRGWAPAGGGQGGTGTPQPNSGLAPRASGKEPADSDGDRQASGSHDGPTEGSDSAGAAGSRPDEKRRAAATGGGILPPTEPPAGVGQLVAPLNGQVIGEPQFTRASGD